MGPSRIVLLHGFTQGGAIWIPVMERLASRCAIEAPDLAGHGSASDLTSSLPEAADQLADEFGLSAWVGYSMGGRLALHVAVRHPEDVSHLVLCSATAGLRDPAERAARRASDAALAERIQTIGLTSFLDEWMNQPLFESLKTDRPDAAHDAEVRLANTASGLASSLLSWGTGSQEPLWAELPLLDMPVLVVSGSLDQKFTAIGTEMVAAIGSNARHVVVPGCGHAVPFEAPDTFAGLVDDFIAVRRGS